MIVNENDAIKRLNSPMNLINRLKQAKNGSKNSAMSLFGIGKKTIDIKTENKQEEIVKVSFNPFPSEKIPAEETSEKTPPQPVLNDILENHESQIKLGLAHDQALELLTNSVQMLATKLDDVKADKLPSVISAASKTVESIRRERNEAAKNGKDREVHYHFYTPEQKKLGDYAIIDVA